MSDRLYISCPSHCCPIHGCKYGYGSWREGECPVASGKVEPTTPNNNGCEMCEHDRHALAKRPGPIRPEDVAARKTEVLPPEVFEVVNTLIVQRSTGGRVTIRQDEIVARLEDHGFARPQIFEQHMLDFESAYREAGWTVKYDKPGYNETYPSTFTFDKEKHND